jgi:NADP-dependent 3-hydroxy acid dehydrogenase YdfG
MDHPGFPVILITGASSGIGEATARLFARRGYRVALAARRAERLNALVEQIRAAGGQALAVRTDCACQEDVQGLVQRVLDEWGQIDLLFNNAGFGRLDWLENLDPALDIRAQVEVNLTGLIEVTRAVLPHMIARRQGHIINMSSVAGLVPMPTYSVYAATKFGVRGFTDALRREARAYGVQVSGIYPGAVETEFKQHARIRRKTWGGTPARMRLTAEQVAEAVWSLAQRPSRSLILPRLMALGYWLTLVFPGFADWIIDRAFVRRERSPDNVNRKA